MKKHTALLISTLFLAGNLFVSHVAFAMDVITVAATPNTPSPGQKVTIAVNSYAINLDSADITWYVDKVPAKNGTGAKSLELITPNFGDPRIIDIVIMTIDKRRFDKQFTLKPLEVDILWEADTYTPPFYKGKALPTFKSLVKVSAIARFTGLTSNPLDYYYTWTMQGSTGLGEGLGRTSALVPMGWPNAQIPVKAMATIGSDIGSATQFVPAVDTKVLFYEQAPLLGVRFNKILPNSVTTSNSEFTIRAVPYFYSNDNMRNSELVYTWKQGNNRIPQGYNPNLLTIKRGATAAGATGISLSVQNRKRILQLGDTEAIINFTDAN